MPKTPDRFPGESDEEGLRFSDSATDPTVVGQIVRNGTDLKARDGVGVFNLRSGSGISASEHRTLLQLIHFIDEGPADGFTTGATKSTTGTIFPTQNLWRRSDTTKLVEQNITWVGVTPTPIEWKVYALDGTTVLATVTDVVSYAGVFETGRVRTIA